MQGEVGPGGSPPPFEFTLFVAGEDAKHQAAVYALRQVCERRFPGRYQLAVVDVVQRPDLADEARILATPALVKTSPKPVQRIIGDLGDLDDLLATLDAARNGASP